MRDAGDSRIADAEERQNTEIVRLSEQLAPAAEEEEEEEVTAAPPPAAVTVGPDDPDDMIDGMFKGLPESLAKEATHIYELLLVTGVEPSTAKLKVAELYSPPRVTHEMQFLPVMSTFAPGSTFDLAVGEKGNSYDFPKPKDRARARERLRREPQWRSRRHPQ